MSTVSGGYFSTLGIQPILGRPITPDDLSLDAGYPAAVAVISYVCWRSHYQGNPAVIGKTIQVADRSMTIIGVTPEGFSGLSIDAGPDVTVPIGYSGRLTYRDRKSFGFEVFARLKRDVTIEQAQAQLESSWPGILQQSLPKEYAGAEREAFLASRVLVSPAATGKSFLRQQYARSLYVLMAMAGLLLLVACVNLANLTLARAAGRRQEFGIRAALGAGKWRIVLQMLTESLILSTTGAMIGLGFAYWMSRLLLNTMWTGLIPLEVDATPDIRVLAFTGLVSILTGLLFGVSPAWSIFHADLIGTLKRGGRTIRGGAGALGKTLIAAQVALSLVLVIGAGLFVRSLQKLRSVDLGFRRDGILLVHLFPQSGSESQHMPNRVQYYQQLTERLRSIPGIDAVSYSHMGPALSYEYKEGVSLTSAKAPAAQAVFEAVGPGFFQLAGMRLLAGREFDWRDDEGAQPVALISESLSRRLFPSGNPIGKTIDFGARKGLEIVGVVNSARLWMPQSQDPPAVYCAFLQIPTFNSSFIDIRTGGDPAAILRAARHEIEALGRHYVLRAETLDQRFDSLLLTDRMIAMLSSFFSGLALLLASIGLYGLMSCAVSRRVSEIGLRVALGAKPFNIQMLILKEILWLVLGGLAVGIPAALVASHLISSMVYGVSGSDPATILLSCSILLGTAAAASFAPALRASRIDPASALRSE